ncbi:peptidase M54 [Anaeromyxobacter paludicola]|uniref:Peptidase n=1 Tax=Anaeromyxobacter paludicola TaxID=2918171 RepID=A0ABM7X6F5_9BACT|nr:peptidase M54 [Anaeromyxobacter paludicola]BDG07377.1 peptidase [Anaeromyxobacter paludicola]
MLEHVRAHLTGAFRAEVALHHDPRRPADAWDARRRQHSSKKMLSFLLEQGPPPPARVLGITDQDLFIPILTFVFGEAQLGGRAAVVSTARLDDGVPVVSPRVLAERVAIECVHEVGHAYGLLHCASPRCAMGRSPSVRDVDAKKPQLCRDCLSRLAERNDRSGG